jgi:hypothetical protein
LCARHDLITRYYGSEAAEFAGTFLSRLFLSAPDADIEKSLDKKIFFPYD